MNVGKRTVVIVGLAFSAAALAGCRWEVGKAPLPIPTPTPRPSPTPTPAADSVGAPAVKSLAHKVATANAESFARATSEAVKNATAVRDSLSEAPNDNDALLGALRKAQKYLAAAKQSYLESEASVFLVDPDSPDELRSQPDPFGVAIPGANRSPIDALQSSLKKLEALLEGPLDSSKAADLLSEANSISSLLQQTESGLQEMANAWKPGNAGNFRSRYFLNSPDAALARIFQGLLAMTGDLLPATVAGNRHGDNAEIATRVDAVRQIYLGKDENTPSLHLLVQQASPVQAALTRASIARSSALVSVLEIMPGSESAKSQLAPALQDLTRQLTFAANALGIVIVSDK